MTAVASSQLPTYRQTSNPENISEYVNAHLGQPLAQLSRDPVNTARHYSFLNQENGGGRRPNEPSRGRPNSTNLALPRPDRGQPDLLAQANNLDPSDSRDTLVPRPEQLVRAITVQGPRPPSPLSKRDITEENWELRHGWEDQYNSSEYLGLLTSVSIQRSVRCGKSFRSQLLTWVMVGFLHVLYRQAPRDWRHTKR